MSQANPPSPRWYAIRHLLCPRCYTGAIFRGVLAMNKRCPVCDLRFEREPGYFIGAMYFAYAMSLPTGGALVALIWYLMRWQLWQCMVVALAVYLPFVPLIVRYSRVLWLHWDRAIDPEG